MKMKMKMINYIKLLFRLLTMIAVVSVLGCSGNNDSIIVATFNKKTDPYKKIKENQNNNDTNDEETQDREKIDPEITLVSPSYSPASSGTITINVANGFVSGDTIRVFSEGTCSTELIDKKVKVTSADSIDVTISNLPLGAFTGSIQINDDSGYLSNCISFSYINEKGSVELSGVMPTIGTRDFDFNLKSVKTGEIIKIFSEDNCSNLLISSMVSLTEQQNNLKEISITFPDNFVSGSYDIHYQIVYLDNLTSICSSTKLGTYELDVTPPAAPSDFSFGNSNPSRLVKNPIVSINDLEGVENVRAKIYLGDSTCSDESLLYGESTSTTNEISIVGSLIVSAGNYTFYAQLEDQFENKTNCVQVTPVYVFDDVAPELPSGINLLSSISGSNPSFSFATDIDNSLYSVGDTIGVYSSPGCTGTSVVALGDLKNDASFEYSFDLTNALPNIADGANDVTDSAIFYFGAIDAAGNIACSEEFSAILSKREMAAWLQTSSPTVLTTPRILLSNVQNNDRVQFYTDACLTPHGEEITLSGVGSNQTKIVNLDALTNGSYTISAKYIYQDNTSPKNGLNDSCVSVGDIEIKTEVGKPIISTVGGKASGVVGTDFIPEVMIDGDLEDGAVIKILSGECHDDGSSETGELISTIESVNSNGEIVEVDFASNIISAYSANVSLNLFAKQIDTFGNQKCSDLFNVVLGRPAAPTGLAVSVPSNLQVPANSSIGSEVIAGNIFYPQVSVGSIEASALVKIFNDANCENDLLGSATADVNGGNVIVTLNSLLSRDTEILSLYVKQIGTSSRGSAESPCVSGTSLVKYVFDSTISPPAPVINLLDPNIVNSGLNSYFLSQDNFDLTISPNLVGADFINPGYELNVWFGEVSNADSGCVTDTLVPPTAVIDLTNNNDITYDPATLIGPNLLEDTNYQISFQVQVKGGVRSECVDFNYVYQKPSPSIEILSSGGSDSSPIVMLSNLQSYESYSVHLLSGCTDSAIYTANNTNSQSDIRLNDGSDDASFSSESVNAKFYLKANWRTGPATCVASNSYEFDESTSDLTNHSLVNPTHNIGNLSTPTFSVDSVEPNSTVYLFKEEAQCSAFGDDSSFDSQNAQTYPTGLLGFTSSISGGDGINVIVSTPIESTDGDDFYFVQFDKYGNHSSSCIGPVNYQFDESINTPVLVLSSTVVNPSSLNQFKVDISGLEGGDTILLFEDGRCTQNADQEILYDPIGVNTATVNINLGETGEYTLSARATDAAGNYSPCASINYSYVIGNPLANLQTEDGSTSSLSINITGLNQADKIQFFSNSSCTLNSSPEIIYSQTPLTTTYDISSFALSGNNYSIFYQAIYLDGTTSNCYQVSRDGGSPNYYFDSGVLTPALSLSSPSSSPGKLGAPQLQADSLEIDAGKVNAASTLYLFQGGCVDGVNTDLGNAINSLEIDQETEIIEVNSGDLMSGTTYSYQVKQIDEFGNISNCSNSVSYLFDNTPPDAPSDFALSGGISELDNDNTPQFSFVAENNAVVYLLKNSCTDGINELSSKDAEVLGSVGSIEASALNHGDQVSYYLKQHDEAGNISSCSVAINYQYDGVALDLTNLTFNNPSTVNSSDIATGFISNPIISFSNGETEAIAYAFLGDNSTSADCSSSGFANNIGSSPATSGTININLNSDVNQTYYIWLKQIDSVDNESSCVRIDYVLDTEINSPVLTLETTSPNNSVASPNFSAALSNGETIYLLSSCNTSVDSGGSNSLADRQLDITNNSIGSHSVSDEAFATSITVSEGTTNFYARIKDEAGNISDCSDVVSYTYDVTAPISSISFVGTDLTNISARLENVDLTIDSINTDLGSTTLYWRKIDSVQECEDLVISEMENSTIEDLSSSVSSFDNIDLSGNINGSSLTEGEILCLKIYQVDLASNNFLTSGLTITHISPIDHLEVLNATFTSSEASCVSNSNLNFPESCGSKIIRPKFEFTLKNDGYINDTNSFTLVKDGGVSGEDIVIGENEVMTGSDEVITYQLARGLVNAPGDQITFDYYENGEKVLDNFFTFIVKPIEELFAVENSIVSSLSSEIDSANAVAIATLADTCLALGLKVREAPVEGFCSIRPEVDNELDCDTEWISSGNSGCDSYTIPRHLENQFCVSDSACMIVDTSRMNGTISNSGTKEIACLSNNLYAQSGNDLFFNNNGLFSNPLTNYLVKLSEGEIPHKVFCGNRYNCALLTNGQVKCWGYGPSALGQPFSDRIGRKASEFKLLNNTGAWESANNVKDEFKYHGDLRTIELSEGVFIKDMAVGWHNCAISTDQNLICWGENENGKLGYTTNNLRAYGISLNGDYANVLDSYSPPIGGYNNSQLFQHIQVSQVSSEPILNDLAKGYYDNNSSICYLREYNRQSCESFGGTFTNLYTSSDSRLFFSELTTEKSCVSHGGSWESNECRSMATICSSAFISEDECEADFVVKDVEVTKTNSTCAIYQNTISEEDHVRCFGNDSSDGSLGTYNPVSTYVVSTSIGDLGIIDRSEAVNVDLQNDLTGCYLGYAEGFCEASGGAKFDSTTISQWFNGFTQGVDYTEIPDVSASYCRYPNAIDTDEKCLEKSYYVPPSRVVGLASMDKIDKLVAGRSYYCAKNNDTTDFRCWGDGTTGTLHEGVSSTISSLIYFSNFSSYSLANDLLDFRKYLVCSENENCAIENANDITTSIVDSDAKMVGFGSALCFKGISETQCMGANNTGAFGFQDITPENQFYNLDIIDSFENEMVDFYSTDFVYQYGNSRSLYSGMISFYERDAIMEISCGYFGDDSKNHPKIKCWGFDLNDELGTLSKFHSGVFFDAYSKDIELADGTTVAGQPVDLDSNSIAVLGDTQSTGTNRVNLLQSSTRYFSSDGTITNIISPRYFSKNVIGDNVALSPFRLNSSYVGNKFNDDFMVGWIVESPQFINCGTDNSLTFNITGVDLVLSTCSDGVSQTEVDCNGNTWTSNCDKYYTATEIVDLINTKNGSDIISFSVEAGKYYTHGGAANVVTGNDSNVLLQIGYNLGQTVDSISNVNTGWSLAVGGAFNLVEFNACFNATILNQGDCDSASGLWNSSEAKCFMTTYTDFSTCLGQANHHWFEKLHQELPFGCVDTSINSKGACDSAKETSGRCFRAGVDITSSFNSYDSCLGVFDNNEPGCTNVGGTFVENGADTDHCINAPAHNYWVSDYWGWQDRENHLEANRGLCHRSFSSGNQLDKTTCSGGDLKWFGEIGSACYHANNNIYKNISSGLALDSCIDYHPFFDNE